VNPDVFNSTTITVPEFADIPHHVAIIMDGNGRWARKRFLPRVAGHRRGLEAVRAVTKSCVERGVKFLTLFAFSSENWRRPKEEVSFLMELFIMALEQEVSKLNDNDIRLKVVGDLGSFEPRLTKLISEAEALTAGNSKLTLTIAANYGGRWDILQAVNRMVRDLPNPQDDYREAHLSPYLAMSYAPEPDLFIRTGGEQRISNFLLWQLAYTEFYFTDELWPDFDAQALQRAIESYRTRERRFGRTSDQLATADPALLARLGEVGGDSR
jgi:undecaprenyl diphosphate synthase